ncbi:MAG: AMP-binding protein [Methylobacteriaceae bacterium]|nr:AMP-binding protein [Methylobacteriaceae bacterium]
MTAAPDALAHNTDHPLAAFGLDTVARGAARLRAERLAMAEAGPGAECHPVAYGEFDRLALAFSAHARACGLLPGERVLIVGAARTGVAVAILGAIGAGLEPVIAPAHLTPAALAFLAQSTGAVAVIGPTRYGAFDAEQAMLEIAATAPGVRLLGSLGPGASDGAVDFSPAGLRDPVDANALSIKTTTPARIGLVLAPEQKAPRVVFVSQSEIVAIALDFASRLRLNGERPILSTLSPASLAGLATGPVAALLVGAPLTWFGPFEAQSFIDTLDKAGPCHLIAPEAIAADLAAAGLIAPGRLESLSLATRDPAAAAPPIGASCPVALLASDSDGRMTISLSGA